jgi:hypothetical protein
MKTTKLFDVSGNLPILLWKMRHFELLWLGQLDVGGQQSEVGSRKGLKVESK